MLDEFRRLVRLDRDGTRALVESADAARRTTARSTSSAGLTRLLRRRRSTTSFAENPALIGGMRIRVGSDVYDGSVRARLAALEARL